MFRQAGRIGVAIVLGLTLFIGLGVVLAQEGADQEVILNAVETQQQPGQAAFDVTAYVTVVDASRQPITDLPASAFSLTEDGLPVVPLDVSPATQGANIVLVLDTSGSMAFQGKMDAVKEAATSFVQNLSEEDQVGIISVNETDEILQDLSVDHVAAASIVGLIAAEPGTGTCLYDAAYKAGILATTAPPGRRAVILLTDGVDELPNAPPDVQCSTHTVEDVIRLASDGTTRTPIYAIGVGADVNAEELSQIAGETGGIAATTMNTSEIGDLFDLISLQLKSQYALSYVSVATSNEQHNLAVTITREGSTSVDQRDFILPAPTLLTVSGLADGASLASDAQVTVEVSVSGPGEVAQATLSVDGGPATELSGPPFEYGLDAGSLGAGNHTLAVEVALADEGRLAQAVTFSVAAPVEPPTVDTAPVDEVEEAPAGLMTVMADNVVPVIVGVLVIAALIVLGVVLRTRQQPAGKVIGGASGYTGVEDMTRDVFISQPLATFTVRESLRLLPGQPFDVGELVVRLGRGADNDILVPDESVSRYHAELRLEDGQYLIFDMDSEYGTMVNDQKVGPEGLPLNDGDELSLGTRTRLLFNVLETLKTEPVANPEAATSSGDDTPPADKAVGEARQPGMEDDTDATLPVDDT